MTEGGSSIWELIVDAMEKEINVWKTKNDRAKNRVKK